MPRKITALAALLAALVVPAAAHAATLPAKLPESPVVAETAMPLHIWKQPVHNAKPKGVVIAIHGGGWIGGDMLVTEDPDILRYRQMGWATLNVDYASGWSSIKDVVAFYDLAHRTYPGLPICSSGQSAGGSLAMLLAVYRPALKCALSQEGPTRVGPLLAGRTVPALTGLVRSLFTPAQARMMSPAGRLDGYQGRIVATYSMADTVIPGATELPALRQIKANVRTFQIRGWGAFRPDGTPERPTPKGQHGFVHMNYASDYDVQRFYEAERETLRAVAREAR